MLVLLLVNTALLEMELSRVVVGLNINAYSIIK